MKVYVLIHCSEDDKQIVYVTRERKRIDLFLETTAEERRKDKGVLSCDVVWEDEETVYIQGAVRYIRNDSVYDYFDEFIIEEHEVD